jgi:hypothetical protein
MMFKPSSGGETKRGNLTKILTDRKIDIISEIMISSSI